MQLDIRLQNKCKEYNSFIYTNNNQQEYIIKDKKDSVPNSTEFKLSKKPVN